MKYLHVHSQTGDYPIYIGADEIQQAPLRLQECGIQSNSAIAIITDEHVHQFGHSVRLCKGLQAAGYTVSEHIVAPGEESKSLAMAEYLYTRLLENRIRRNDVIIAVGGGVIGDLAGFVAATYMRGIRFIQVPTTLLAHDSSLGGKVGVNLQQGKNLVGAFHRPTAILYDVQTLTTLPQREWKNGMAEVIKHGIIGNQTLLKKLLHSPLQSCPDEETAIHILAEAMAVKVNIVEADEHESYLRMVLNVGHTVGHAIEQLSHYKIGHGEAVAIGICVEAHISVGRGLLHETDREIIEKIIQLHGLPTKSPEFHIEDLLALIDVDKKHGSAGWTFAVPIEVGQVELIQGVSAEEVRLAWSKQMN